MSEPREVRAPRGTTRKCKNWQIEAAYRMIQNNLDPEVAGDPNRLVVYGGSGKAARSWEAFDAILKSLIELEEERMIYEEHLCYWSRLCGYYYCGLFCRSR